MTVRARDAQFVWARFVRASSSALATILLLGLTPLLRGQSAGAPNASNYKLLYSFRCAPDGDYPAGGLVQDPSGNLYGTTNIGGEFGYGTVFKLSTSGIETVLHSFAGPPDDAAYPYSGAPVLDSAGNVYGTTWAGGEYSEGAVYRVTPKGAEKVLYSFTGGSDGAAPYGGMAVDSAGDLFGTASQGGAFGQGVVFELTPNGTETVLHSFSNSPDGADPSGDLVRDSSGNLFGTTQDGGAYSAGTVFEVTSSGEESPLHSFVGYPVDGAYPFGGGLLRDPSGNLYGVAVGGGTNSAGVVFEVNSADKESVLFDFNGGTTGQNPFDGLAEDSAGNLYGTTGGGGLGGTGCPGHGCGLLFELSPSGQETVLHNFSIDDGYPVAGVVRAPTGDLYGTLEIGGTSGCGAVFLYAP